MALTGIQYQSMRLKFRGLLSNPYQSVSEAELDSFLGQLTIDVTGLVTAAQKTQADTLLAGVLSSPAYVAVSADVATFFAQAAAALPLVLNALVATRYQQLKNQLTGALSIAGVRNEAQMLGYLAAYLTTNFGALVPGVALYLRGDLGLSTTGSIVNAWANQAGSVTTLTEKTGGAGVGTVGSGIGGRPSVVQDGVTQAATFTLSLAAPGTTPTFYYLVSKQLRTSLAGHAQRIICNTANNNMVLYQDQASDNLIAFGDTANSTLAITHIWARTAVLYSGSTADRFKWGNLAELTGVQLQTAAGGVSSMLFGYDPTSGTYNQGEFGLVIIGSGVTAANYVATMAALDAVVASFYGGLVTL